MYPGGMQGFGIELITAIAVIAILVLVVVVIMMMKNTNGQLARLEKIAEKAAAPNVSNEINTAIVDNEAAEVATADTDAAPSISPFVEITDEQDAPKISDVATTTIEKDASPVFIQEIGKGNTSFSVAAHSVAAAQDSASKPQTQESPVEPPTTESLTVEDIFANQTAFVEPGFLKKKEQQMQSEDFLSFLNIGEDQQDLDASRQTKEWQIPQTPTPSAEGNVGRSGKRYTKEELEALIRN